MCILIAVGATVHLVCRNKERGETAKSEITRESSNEVHTYSSTLYLSF